MRDATSGETAGGKGDATPIFVLGIQRSGIRDDFRDILKFSEDSLNDVWGNKDDEIWNKYL